MDDFSISSLNIKDITETTDYKESKKLLSDGWHLLNCYIQDDLNVYVLGLPQSTIEIKNSQAYKYV